jgi:hypothetical protein
MKKDYVEIANSTEPVVLKDVEAERVHINNVKVSDNTVAVKMTNVTAGDIIIDSVKVGDK